MTDAMEEVDCIVAGGGAIGLAVARALALAGREVLLLEAEGAIGTGISSRNSEVIHAGIYYAADSLMARFCVAGRKALYAYCAARGIPHRRCGKLIVATNAEELARLDSIRGRAAANGVDDLVVLPAAEAKAMEPALACTGALHSPSTGIIDSHAYMQALLADLEAHGGLVALHCPVMSAAAEGSRIVVRTGGEAPMALACRLFVNAAGHGAIPLARAMTGLAPDSVPQAYFAKGNYFSLAGRQPFSRLIYPVPVAGGLGVHLTLDLAGQCRFGPDVQWIDALDYSVDPARADRFYDAIRKYWPALPDDALRPDYAGIRPKIVPPAIANQDFVIQDSRVHGARGVIQLFGIESPGLTASLALADHVAALAARETA